MIIRRPSKPQTLFTNPLLYFTSDRKLLKKFRFELDTLDMLTSDQKLARSMNMDGKVARRGGFEPPSPFGHWISNPTPYRAGPSPLRNLSNALSFLNFRMMACMMHFKPGTRYSGYYQRLRSVPNLYVALLRILTTLFLIKNNLRDAMHCHEDATKIDIAGSPLQRPIYSNALSCFNLLGRKQVTLLRKKCVTRKGYIQVRG
jgi:hypothetical protein